MLEVINLHLTASQNDSKDTPIFFIKPIKTTAALNPANGRTARYFHSLSNPM
jgi:hypothetical protein